jgi:hypothetical protein
MEGKSSYQVGSRTLVVSSGPFLAALLVVSQAPTESEFVRGRKRFHDEVLCHFAAFDMAKCFFLLFERPFWRVFDVMCRKLGLCESDLLLTLLADNQLPLAH